MRKSKGEGGSVVLERPLKLWCLIIDSVRCGGGTERKKSEKQQGGSDKLKELLKQAEWWESNTNEEEVRRKEEVLQRLKNVAKKLQSESESMSAAAEVRRLTKDDPDARTTLALLGVIPPLVALLDPPASSTSQIPALYALLNLAIANDQSVSLISLANI